jgi:hypothetical protein
VVLAAAHSYREKLPQQWGQLGPGDKLGGSWELGAGSWELGAGSSEQSRAGQIIWTLASEIEISF